MNEHTFPLMLDDQEMIIRYRPNYFQGSFPVGHFEFHSPYDPPRRIPVSETGYRSHFVAMPDIEAFDSPEACALAVALALQGRDRNAPKKDGQLPLF